jgi:hypothetical protein
LISSNAEGEEEEEEGADADAAWLWLSAPTLRDLKPQRLLKNRLTAVSNSAATCGFDIPLRTTEHAASTGQYYWSACVVMLVDNRRYCSSM